MSGRNERDQRSWSPEELEQLDNLAVLLDRDYNEEEQEGRIPFVLGYAQDAVSSLPRGGYWYKDPATRQPEVGWRVRPSRLRKAGLELEELVGWAVLFDGESTGSRYDYKEGRELDGRDAGYIAFQHVYSNQANLDYHNMQGIINGINSTLLPYNQQIIAPHIKPLPYDADSRITTGGALVALTKTASTDGKIRKYLHTAVIGDVRIYRDGGLGRLTLLTKDDREDDPRTGRSVLSKQLGAASHIEISSGNYRKTEVYPGDSVLICSRNIHSKLSSSDLHGLIQDVMPHQAAQDIVEAATLLRSRGPVSALVIDVALYKK